jgi:hypothetical protein
VLALEVLIQLVLPLNRGCHRAGCTICKPAALGGGLPLCPGRGLRSADAALAGSS